MELIVFYLGFAILCGILASTNKRSGFGYFVLALLISPLLCGLLLIIIGKKTTGETSVKPAIEPRRITRPCPFCAEQILSQAIRCKHCGADITPEPVIEETTEDKVKRYGIYRDAGQYIYGKYRYNSIDEAIADAEKENGSA